MKTQTETTTTPPGTQKKPRGEVYLYPNWCKGCQICVEFCPAQVLAFDEERHRPYVAAPENCTGCLFCDTHCPDLAIVVKRLY